MPYWYDVILFCGDPLPLLLILRVQIQPTLLFSPLLLFFCCCCLLLLLFVCVFFCLFFNIFLFIFYSSATDQQYGIRTNFRQLAKLHGHTNEHVQFKGAHQEINRSLLPCRHTDNDVHRYLGHASMFLLTLHRTMSHSVWPNQSYLKLGLLAM